MFHPPRYQVPHVRVPLMALRISLARPQLQWPEGCVIRPSVAARRGCGPAAAYSELLESWRLACPPDMRGSHGSQVGGHNNQCKVLNAPRAGPGTGLRPRARPKKLSTASRWLSNASGRADPKHVVHDFCSG
jgi:hypothetical protein